MIGLKKKSEKSKNRYERNLNNAQKFSPEISINIILISGINYSYYSYFFPKEKENE